MNHSLTALSTQPTLIDLVRQHAQTHADRVAQRFLADGELDGVIQEQTYAELDRRARSIAAHLQERAAPGARLLLLYPSGLDFFVGFLGAIMAGCIPVPVYPPDPARFTRSLERLRGIIADCTPEIVLTTSGIQEIAASMLPDEPLFRGLWWLSTDDAPDHSGAWRYPKVDGATIAFLQYTSGSTGSPKGVIISHQNLLANLAQLEAAVGLTQRSAAVFWLPHYHDMGLIGGFLQPLYTGIPLIFMSPLDFLQRPVRWLRAITKYRGTTTGAPNFAYDLCARKTKEADKIGLDLSSWEVSINGAEPIRAETLENFYQAFKGCGLRREMMNPAYGLAEATVYVTGKPKLTPPVILRVAPEPLRQHQVLPSDEPGAAALVSCGVLAEGIDLKILGPDGASLAERQIGELCLRGPNITRGYWQRGPEGLWASHQNQEYLRTGDLGFLYEGQLYLTGRLKDLIIQNGQNLYPHDLEKTVERLHPAVRPGCVAAFSILGESTERVVLLAELDPRWEGVFLRGEAPLIEGALGDANALCQAIQEALFVQHEVSASVVQLISAGSLPKTPSGKLQRRAAREAFLRGEFTAIGALEERPTTLTTAELYEALLERFVRLDRRNTRYQYDLERDICWGRIGESGLFAGEAFLRLNRIDLEALQRQPEVSALFQWAIGVGLCDRFVLLEEALLGFTHEEHNRLGPTQSLRALEAEEHKHIETFRRFGEHLRGLRPELLGYVDEARKSSEGLLQRFFSFDPAHYASHAERHYACWLLALFFEEYTIYVYQLLAQEQEGAIQPTWLSMHKAHAQEEVHHVLTDQAYLEALRASEEDRYAWSKKLFDSLALEIVSLFAVIGEGAIGLCRQVYPESERWVLPSSSGVLPIVAILQHEAFSRTISAAPYFAYVLQRNSEATPPKNSGETTQAAKALESWIERWISINVRQARLSFDPTRSFSQYGLDSVQLVSLSGDLEAFVGRRLSPTITYDYPTPALLAEKVAATGEVLPVVSPLLRPGPLPLTARQERLWHLEQAHPRQVLDHITSVYLIESPEASALQASLEALARHHEMLRASFIASEGRPAQLVSTSIAIELAVQDWRHLSAETWREEVRAFAARQDLTPFDLTRAPLWRAALLRGPKEQGALILTVHHIVTDGWSMENLWRDLSALYQGRSKRLSVLASQYPEVAAREQVFLVSEEARARLQWWRGLLDGHPQLSAEAPGRAFRGAAVTRPLADARLTARLSALSRRAGVSLYMLLLTAFIQQQQRRAKREDILVNTHLFNRHSEAERVMIGYFVNLLTLRPSIALETPLPEALRAVHISWMEAVEHALPIDHLVRELMPTRYTERAMPSRVAFNMLSLSFKEEEQVAVLEKCPALAPPPGFMFFDQMMLATQDADGRLVFTLWHNREVISLSEAEEIVADLCQTLEGLASREDQ